jgi:hypothetical protein
MTVYLSPIASALTSAGNSEIDVTGTEVNGAVDLVGFNYDQGKQAWVRAWDSSVDPEIDVEINISVFNALESSEEIEWKAEINITIIRWDPYFKESATWNNDNWPNYESWDDTSEDIYDTLPIDDTTYPAAFAEHTWDFYINITTWWDDGSPDTAQDQIVGIIEVY